MAGPKWYMAVLTALLLTAAQIVTLSIASVPLALKGQEYWISIGLLFGTLACYFCLSSAFRDPGVIPSRKSLGLPELKNGYTNWDVRINHNLSRLKFCETC